MQRTGEFPAPTSDWKRREGKPAKKTFEQVSIFGGKLVNINWWTRG